MAAREPQQTIERAVARLRERAQSQVEMTDAARVASLGEVQLLALIASRCSEREAARLVAKRGADSTQVADARRRVLEQRAIAVLAQADIERLQAPDVTANKDTFVYQGRVVDDQGIGVADRTVLARAANGQGLVATKTDAQGNFALTFEGGRASSAADRQAALDPSQPAPARVTRAAVRRGLQFSVDVADASGGSSSAGDTPQTVQLGQVGSGEIVVDDAAASAAHDVLARVAKRLPAIVRKG